MSKKELDKMMLEALKKKKAIIKKRNKETIQKENEFLRYEEFQKNLILNYLKENNLIEQLDEVSNWFLEHNIFKDHEIIKKWTKEYKKYDDYEWNAVEFIYGIDAPNKEIKANDAWRVFAGISFHVIDYDLEPDESLQWVRFSNHIPLLDDDDYSYPIIDSPDHLVKHFKKYLTDYVAITKSLD